MVGQAVQKPLTVSQREISQLQRVAVCGQVVLKSLEGSLSMLSALLATKRAAVRLHICLDCFLDGFHLKADNRLLIRHLHLEFGRHGIDRRMLVPKRYTVGDLELVATLFDIGYAVQQAGYGRI